MDTRYRLQTAAFTSDCGSSDDKCCGGSAREGDHFQLWTPCQQRPWSRWFFYTASIRVLSVQYYYSTTTNYFRPSERARLIVKLNLRPSTTMSFPWICNMRDSSVIHAYFRLLIFLEGGSCVVFRGVAHLLSCVFCPPTRCRALVTAYPKQHIAPLTVTQYAIISQLPAPLLTSPRT